MNVSKPALFFRFKVWVFLIPLVFALLFTSFALSERRTARMIAQEGRTVEGVVLQKSHTSDRDPGQQIGSDNYSVVFAYSVEGTGYENAHGITEDMYAAIDVDGPVTVHYAASDPATSSIEPIVAERAIYWIGPVALIFFAAACVLFRWRWKLFRSALRAARDPAPRSARVEDHVAGGMSVGSTQYRSLTWRSAQNLLVTSRPMPSDRLGAWPVGSEITVYRDAETDREWFAADLAGSGH